MDKKLTDKNTLKKAVIPTRDRWTGVLTGHALSLRKNRLEYMYQCFKNHGDFLIMYLGRKRTLLVNDPVGLKYVFFENAKNYPKNTPGYQRVAEVIGQGVFTDVGVSWRQGRKIIQPIFNPSKFDYYFSIVDDESEKLVQVISQEIQKNSIQDFSYWSTKYALNVIGKSLINESLEESFNIISQKLSELIDLTELKMTRIFPFKTAKVKKEDQQFARALKDLDDEIKKIIEREKNKKREGTGNFIHILLDSKEQFSEEKILSQVKTMVFAGHETSANVIAWGFYFLTLYPKWQEKIHQELQDKKFKIESEDDVRALVHVNLFVQEVLRMRPPAWSFGRVALERDKIHGEDIYPGDLISISPYLIHHHPDYWDEPMEFKPERFLSPPLPMSYIPYGAGQRVCMGERLANLEIAMVFLKVIKNFKLNSVEKNFHIPMNAQVSLRPKNAVVIKLEKR